MFVTEEEFNAKRDQFLATMDDTSPKHIRIDLLEMPPGSHPMDTPDEWMKEFKHQLERTLRNQGTGAQVTIVEDGFDKDGFDKAVSEFLATLDDSLLDSWYGSSRAFRKKILGEFREFMTQDKAKAARIAELEAELAKLRGEQ